MMDSWLWVGVATGVLPACVGVVVAPIPLPTVEEDTESLMDEGGAVAAAVLIPILGILIVAKILHGLHFSRSASDSQLTGIPLSLGSSVLTLGCVVLLCIATYAMTQEAGSDAANSAFRNNKANMAYANARNNENVKRLARDVLVKMWHHFRSVSKRPRNFGYRQVLQAFSYSPYYPASSDLRFRPYSSDWKQIVQGVSKAWVTSTKMLPHRNMTVDDMSVALYSDNGYYWDSTGLSTDETQVAKDGAVWNDAAQRAAALARVPEGLSVPYDDPATGDRTVAQVQNGWLYDYTISDTVCEDSVPTTDAQLVSDVCGRYTAGLGRRGKLRRGSAYDPMKWALNSHLPPAPPDEEPYADWTQWLARYVRTTAPGVINSRYEMVHTTVVNSTTPDVIVPPFTTIWPCDPQQWSDYGLFIALSLSASSVNRDLQAGLQTWGGRFAENATYLATRRNTGTLVFTNAPGLSALTDVVVNRKGMRFGTMTQTRDNSSSVQLNAVSNYILKGLHLQNSLYQEDSMFVFELDQAEHYSRVSSVLMYYPLDGGVADASGERWETATVRAEALADGTVRTTPVAPAYAAGVYGSGLRFDGATALVVYPYLTVRVPRVWA
eukprot:Rhum_TRINITY_DN14463_c1_g1::Rhum_TRINITY_DN14463_c1_g1_i3::g.89401::m.89401